MTDTAVLMLPFPPSVWALHKRNRHKTQRYLDWEAEAAFQLSQQKPLPVCTEPVAIALAAARPDKRRRDIDNLAKPSLDVLVKHGILEDDSLVHDLRIYWAHPSEVESGVRVEITAL